MREWSGPAPHLTPPRGPPTGGNRRATDWSCTLQCLCTLRAADARWRWRPEGPPQAHGETGPLQEAACPRRVSHLSRRSAAKEALGSSDAACEHALLHKDKRIPQHIHTHMRTLVTVRQNRCSERVFQAQQIRSWAVAAASPAVQPLRDGSADSRSDSLARCSPAWLPSCLQPCRSPPPPPPHSWALRCKLAPNFPRVASVYNERKSLQPCSRRNRC